MKRKKIIFGALALMIVGASALGNYVVNADTPDVPTPYAMTLSTKGPAAYAGKTTRGGTHKMSADDNHNNITVGDTGVTFSNKGWLRENVCVADNDRKLYVVLMEEDATGGDDVVKTYTWSFNGRQLSSVKIEPYNATTLIESSTDTQAELYLKQTLDFKPGDSQSSNGELYYYKIMLD